MSKEVRVGIIGLGNMGQQHARSIRDKKVAGMVLAALADERSELAELFPETPFFSTGPELMDSGLIDAVIIATPHFSHTTLGIQSLEAGLHTMVEKPISAHKADCERLIAAKEGKDVVFAAMFNQRTDPAYVKVKQLIEGGELGRINRIQWTITNWFRTDSYYASGGWRATWAGEGGGVLLNQCPHQLDLWQWLFGMPDLVWADCQIGHSHAIEVEDEVTAVLKYADGKRGVFITSTGEAPGTNRLEIACERGRVVLEDGRISWLRNEVETSDFLRMAKGSFDKPGVWQVEIPISDKVEQHVGILKNFARAILDGETLIAPAEEGIRSVELGNAMLLSGAEGVEVSLPIDAARYEKLLQGRIAASKPKVLTANGKAVSAVDFSKSY